ncbi:MAG TPA: hypothetical protein DDY52_03365 [Candidatus Moranbacteria bacterium]|nr:hypothetical protein [Candidatus Moranbacteria bacterium]
MKRIKEKLQKARNKMITTIPDCDFNLILNVAESALKEQRKEILSCCSKKIKYEFKNDEDPYIEGYNQCIKEFLNNLKEKGL